MNAIDVLKYGHIPLLKTLESAPLKIVNKPGACGTWSPKDILSHLTSYELVLIDIFHSIKHKATSPLFTQYRARDHDKFNKQQVAIYSKKTFSEMLEKYKETYSISFTLATSIPKTIWTQKGILNWYGNEYDLEDFIVYTYFGHKREHGSQIAQFISRTQKPQPRK